MKLRRLLPGRSTTARDVRVIANNPDLALVLDEAWYLARYPDVMNSPFTSRDHFLSSGIHEWRNPSPFVDLRFIAEALPQATRTGPSALRRLLEGGLDRGIASSPFVDLDWYARENSLDALSARDRFAHLVTEGRSTQADPSPWFDLAWYHDRHPEIHLGGLDPFDYFLSVGRWLHRFPHPLWDEQRYVALNDYVRTAIGSGKYSSGFEQFCAAGHEEAAREGIALPLIVAGRPDEYSESRYLAADPEAAAALESSKVRSGLEYLMTRGHKAITSGRAVLKHASPFSSATVETTGTPSSGTMIVLLNHYDPDRRLDPHVETAMATYRLAGADVVLVTTGLSDADLSRARSQATHIITKSRNDDLRDFGGWHHAIESLGTAFLARYHRVILTNDSIYFPVRTTDPFFTALLASSSDVFAATDSVSGGRYHLQSYFLALSPRALAVMGPELARRVAEQAEGTKLTLIQRFEVGLSEYALEQHLSTEAFVGLRTIDDLANATCPPDPRPLSALAAMNLNVTHHLWRTTLVRDLPFLKVELLRDNPVEVDIDDWESAVDGPCSADLITAHLARVRR